VGGGLVVGRPDGHDRAASVHWIPGSHRILGLKMMARI